MATICKNTTDHKKFWQIQQGENSTRICYGSTATIDGQKATDVMPNLYLLGYNVAGSMAFLEDLSEMYMWDTVKRDWNKL